MIRVLAKQLAGGAECGLEITDCLSEQGHQPGVALEVEGGFSGAFVLLGHQVNQATQLNSLALNLTRIQLLARSGTDESVAQGTGLLK